MELVAKFVVLILKNVWQYWKEFFEIHHIKPMYTIRKNLCQSRNGFNTIMF